jgi:hypothetical protein
MDCSSSWVIVIVLREKLQRRRGRRSMSAVIEHVAALEDAREFVATMLDTETALPLHVNAGTLEALDRVLEDLRTEASMRRGDETE